MAVFLLPATRRDGSARHADRQCSEPYRAERRGSYLLPIIKFRSPCNLRHPSFRPPLPTAFPLFLFPEPLRPDHHVWNPLFETRPPVPGTDTGHIGEAELNIINPPASWFRNTKHYPPAGSSSGDSIWPRGLPAAGPPLPVRSRGLYRAVTSRSHCGNQPPPRFLPISLSSPRRPTLPRTTRPCCRSC